VRGSLARREARRQRSAAGSCCLSWTYTESAESYRQKSQYGHDSHRGGVVARVTGSAPALGASVSQLVTTTPAPEVPRPLFLKPPVLRRKPRAPHLIRGPLAERDLCKLTPASRSLAIQPQTPSTGHGIGGIWEWYWHWHWHWHSVVVGT
jgi:hypothetical protein